LLLGYILLDMLKLIKGFLLKSSVTIAICAVVALVLFFSFKPILAKNNLTPQKSVKDLALNPEYQKELTVKQNDVVVGNINAPVTLISYDSYSCSHCAYFYKTTLKDIDEKYIRSGIVRFVHRDFPTDKIGIDVARLMECYKNDFAKGDSIKVFALTNALYSTQQKWLGADYINLVSSQLKMAGMSDDAIKACLADGGQQNGYVKTAVDNLKKTSNILGIAGTPTVFVNGVRNEGKNSPDVLMALIDEAYEKQNIDEANSEPETAVAADVE